MTVCRKKERKKQVKEKGSCRMCTENRQEQGGRMDKGTRKERRVRGWQRGVEEERWILIES